MYRRILVPLDGTRFGDRALPYAVDLAVRTGADLELVHVHQHVEQDPNLAAMPQYQYQRIGLADLEHDSAEVAAARQALEATASRIEARYRVNAWTRVVVGRTDDALLHEVRELDVDMIVMSTHARQGLARLRHGNLAQTLITRLNLPTLCVHPGEGQQPLTASHLRRVLVPLDGSDFSEQILEPLMPLLTALDAQPTLLHVVWPRPLLSTGFDASQRSIVNREQALAYLHEVAHRHRGRMPDPVLTAFEDTAPGQLIRMLLDMGEYDMVAMATHGRSGLARLLAGSVPTDVLQQTDRPMLLYRPEHARVPADEHAQLA
jgi:nucleotide-binding universal stress UspA family protein